MENKKSEYFEAKDDKERFRLLQELIEPHVRSFDYLLQEGLMAAVDNLNPLYIDREDEVHPAAKFWIEEVVINKPENKASVGKRLFPRECRQGSKSYTGTINIRLFLELGTGETFEYSVNAGELPIMVRSTHCYLHGLDPKSLVAQGEEPAEQGGYFLVNGAERIIRMLILPRRNLVQSLFRKSYANRGPQYTSYATTIRCVRDDQSGETVNCHYLKNGDVRVRLIILRQELFIPATVLLFALRQTTSREIYTTLTGSDDTKMQDGMSTDSWISSRVENMLRRHRFKTRHDVLVHLGSVFRTVFRHIPKSWNDIKIANYLLDEHLFVHISKRDSQRNAKKFQLLLAMIKQLYKLVKGDIKAENPDALSSHEILMPGHLVLMTLKEKLQEFVYGIKNSIAREIRTGRFKSLRDRAHVKKLFDVSTIGSTVNYLITTGNLRSNTGLDLMQTSGFTIVADKLNYYRYLSHFRAVHRGQFFMEMKTTAVRKLLPESWGFMCPVHTPDGSPCGLLNHMASPCRIVTHPPAFDIMPFKRLLRSFGMLPIESHPIAGPSMCVVMVDGVILGHIHSSKVIHADRTLRIMKIEKAKNIPKNLEIISIPDEKDRLFPGLHISTTPARFTRPVYNLQMVQKLTNDAKSLSKEKLNDCIEWISPKEQCFLHIACTPDDFRAGITTHQEIHPRNILSLIASLTPFSDFNQSPRNMYQCQMGKQTMGHPLHSFPNRSDNTCYRIQTPQAAIVRNENLSKYGMDEYPLGTNAVVAVISYTGYDMEDAMIINKSAFERGFKHGSVYKYKTVHLEDHYGRGEADFFRFGNTSFDKSTSHIKRKMIQSLDYDGLPSIGQTLNPSDPLVCILDGIRKKPKIVKLKGVTEKCIVSEVRVIKETKGRASSVGIKLLLNRNPVIGDKFSSRHGQKGVMSRLFPQTDMPFSESGLSPDIIINPHAFPSRMTIGMLIESAAGKAGAMHGTAQDASPFQFSEQYRAVDHFGKQLVKAGYNYCGNETLYSGFTGEPFTAEIFMGIVYYQRLRHMVSDKSQVRSTGPVNNLTRQPIKGRKVHGGIRFGEMERDSLLAHGTSFLLHDRLVECSDYHQTWVCDDCGTLLGVSPVLPTIDAKILTNVGVSSSFESTEKQRVKCQACGSERISEVVIPYVFTYLAHELGAMGIRLTMATK